MTGDPLVSSVDRCWAVLLSCGGVVDTGTGPAPSPEGSFSKKKKKCFTEILGTFGKVHLVTWTLSGRVGEVVEVKLLMPLCG